jgi:uncharacterized protein (TIGR04442 family)
MIREIRLQGKANEKIDYSVTIIGADLSNRYYYESIPEGDRFFSGGNEFVVTRTGVRYMGTGGHVCQYMFGVDLPLQDLLRKDVSNRLVMFGAYDDRAESITFTNTTASEETFDRIFLTGNAVSNYFFFIDSFQKAELRDIQREILRKIGKQVKRSEAVGKGDDSRLCREIFDTLDDPRSFVFLFRLVNRQTEEYFTTFHRMYTEHKQLPAQDVAILNALADLHDLPAYQQERIKIDGMYKLAENKKVVDEYKDILIAVSETGEVNPSELAKLSRLRTLSLRLNIPSNLFDTLDELLLKDMQIIEVEEPEFIRETRAICEGFFLKTGELRHDVSTDDLIKLLKAKQRSMASRDPAFESLLLDTVRAGDELARDTNDITIMEGLMNVLTYFDRYDTTATTVNNLAFMERAAISADSIRSLAGNMDVFDKVRPGLFHELFFADLRDNLYLTRFGRRKADTLYKGLEKIKSGDMTYRDLAAAIAAINAEEKMYTLIHRYIKERFRSIYAELNSKEDQEIFIQDLNREIQTKGLIKGPVPYNIYVEIILDIRKESFYLNNLLPHIIISRDSRVREDFLNNSGLDRFYVEELERDYFEMNQIDSTILEEIRT